MSLTEFNTPKKAEGAEQTLRHVLEQGVTVLNTACFYGDSLNEEIIGTAMGLPHSPVMMPHRLQFNLAASSMFGTCEQLIRRGCQQMHCKYCTSSVHFVTKHGT